MRWIGVVSVGALVLPWIYPSPTRDADALPASATQPGAGIIVWDTGRPAALPLGETPDSVKGDAVLSNGRVVAVLRRQSPEVDLLAVTKAGATPRLRLRLLTTSGESAARLERV